MEVPDRAADMVLTSMKIRTAAAALMLMLTLIAGTGPALAHKDHDRQQQAAAAAPPAGENPDAPRVVTPGVVREMMQEHGMAAEPPATFPERLIDWIGRIHPFAVHFPIALFPISWIALIFARRRGDAPDLIRAFIVFAGLAAAGSAVLGWLDAGFALADNDGILLTHRWTGTAVGLIGLAVAGWAWRRPGSVASRAMTWSLGLTTALLLFQGWLGGALIHGVDHMNF